mmetsp:Transcript_11356/g.32242  ORF Transcript_11356/g.32242 Transcript_11356/m.32242 type:complete len:240 (-) Transcript_11356:303-1022(-)
MPHTFAIQTVPPLCDRWGCRHDLDKFPWVLLHPGAACCDLLLDAPRDITVPALHVGDVKQVRLHINRADTSKGAVEDHSVEDASEDLSDLMGLHLQDWQHNGLAVTHGSLNRPSGSSTRGPWICLLTQPLQRVGGAGPAVEGRRLGCKLTRRPQLNPRGVRYAGKFPAPSAPNVLLRRSGRQTGAEAERRVGVVDRRPPSVRHRLDSRTPGSRAFRCTAAALELKWPEFWLQGRVLPGW